MVPPCPGIDQKEILIDTLKANLANARMIRLLWATTFICFAVPTSHILIKTLRRTLEAYYTKYKGRKKHGAGPPWWQNWYQMVKHFASAQVPQPLQLSHGFVRTHAQSLAKPSDVKDICAMLIIKEQRGDAEYTNITLQVFPEHRDLFGHIQHMIVQYLGGERLPGGPPPSQLERRLVQHLRTLGVKDRYESA